MKQAEFERHVGAENICPSIADAIERAASLYRTRTTSLHEEFVTKVI
jgi:hypothetical protein